MAEQSRITIAVIGVDIGKNSFTWLASMGRVRIALANKLARIAWAVLAKGRAFEMRRANDALVRPA